MFEAKSKTIDGTNFKTIPFPAIEALKLKAYLLKTFGPALGRALGSLGSQDESSELNINGAEVAAAIQTLFMELDENAYIDLIKRLLKNVSCEISGESGKVFTNLSEDFEAKMDIVFQERLFTIFEVIFFVLEANFPDFFAKVEGIGSRVKTMLSKKDDKSDAKSSTESVPSES